MMMSWRRRRRRCKQAHNSPAAKTAGEQVGCDRMKDVREAASRLTDRV